jgi:hypothetical protein
MSKAALAKLSKEEALLDSHLTTLKRSATTVEACKECVAERRPSMNTVSRTPLLSPLTACLSLPPSLPSFFALALPG